MHSNYFARHVLRERLINAEPLEDTGLAIVIPALDEPHLLRTLKSLRQCTRPPQPTEVIVVINHSETTSPSVRAANADLFRQCTDWANFHSDNGLQFHILFEPDLPAKKAGVGLARKIGMDEAVRRFVAAGNDQGGIVCLDADCTCAPGYLQALHDFFDKQKACEGCSIYFEHPLKDLSPDHRSHITKYELHLRYLIGIQRWAGFPFAYQTVGSAMAVRASTYIAIGGMNMRQAGEDFYFLHKVIERGRFADLTSTTVYPSPRISDRVPFGTGKAMAEALDGEAERLTYNYRSFQELRELLWQIPTLHATPYEKVASKLPATVADFLNAIHAGKRIEEIRSNTASLPAFVKRCHRWFNAFRLMKYMHFARDVYPDVPVSEACQWLLDKVPGIVASSSHEGLLMAFREMDRRQVLQVPRIA